MKPKLYDWKLDHKCSLIHFYKQGLPYKGICRAINELHKTNYNPTAVDHKIRAMRRSGELKKRTIKKTRGTVRKSLGTYLDETTYTNMMRLVLQQNTNVASFAREAIKEKIERDGREKKVSDGEVRLLPAPN